MELLTCRDIIACSSELIETFEVGIAELDVLQLDCQILDMIGDVGRQWLRIWSVNNFSRHLGLMLFLLLSVVWIAKHP